MMDIGVLSTSLVAFINNNFLCEDFLKKNIDTLKGIIKKTIKNSGNSKNYSFMYSSYPIQYEDKYNENIKVLDGIKFFCVYGTEQRKQYSKTQGCFSLVFDKNIKRANGNETFHYKLHFPLSNDISQEIFLHSLMNFFAAENNVHKLLEFIRYESNILFEYALCECNYNVKNVDIFLIYKN